MYSDKELQEKLNWVNDGLTLDVINVRQNNLIIEILNEISNKIDKDK